MYYNKNVQCISVLQLVTIIVYSVFVMFMILFTRKLMLIKTWPICNKMDFKKNRGVADALKCKLRFGMVYKWHVCRNSLILIALPGQHHLDVLFTVTTQLLCVITVDLCTRFDDP